LSDLPILEPSEFMARLLPHVSSLLEELRGRLPLLLGRTLVGLYTYGSLTQRAFDPKRSDVDCIAVTRRDLSRAELSALRRELARLATANPWTARLQLLIVLKHELLKMNGTGYVYQFGRLSRSGSDGNPIIWLNVLESGRVLVGPEPRSFVPPITPAMLFQALTRELRYLRVEISEKPHGKWRDVRSYRAYTALTVCRILYSLRTGRIVSKPRAAAWAIGAVPIRYHALIRAALQRDAGRRLADLPLAGIRPFIEYAEARLRARPRGAIR
jgi:hypothetical protein